MKPFAYACLLLAIAAGLLAGCRSPVDQSARPTPHEFITASNVIQTVKARFAPDSHLNWFTVGVSPASGKLVLTGEVDRVEVKVAVLDAFARARLKADDQIEALSDARLGDETCGITCLSVANGR